MEGITNIGKELRKRRVMAGLSVKSVATASGFHSYSRLSDYEHGVHVPQEKTRQRILDAIRMLDKRSASAEGIRRILNAICNRMGIDRSEVARRLGVDKTQVSRWYRGLSIPDEKHMKALDKLHAEAMTVPLDIDEKGKRFK